MFFYHFIQMSLDCRTAYSRIATFPNHAIKFTERLKRIERSLAFDDTTAPNLVSFNIIKVYRILFHHILYHDNIIVVSIRSYHLLFYVKVYLEDSFDSVIARLIQKQGRNGQSAVVDRNDPEAIAG